MMLRLSLFMLLLAGLLLAWAPASLLDAALARASDGRLRLLDASGSVWSGAGTFASLSSDGRAAQPWLEGHWRAEFGQLLAGRIGWRVSELDATVLQLRLAPDGIEVTEADLDAPLRPLLDSIPHPLARAGWRGSARLSTPGWRCGWRGECQGSALLTWIDAGVELVPGRRFGDYELAASARGRAGTLQLRTLAGELRIDGQGGWSENGRVRFEGRVEGPPEIVGRLPNVMDGIAFPTGKPGVAEIRLR